MESRAAVEALEAVEASVAALAAVVRGVDSAGSGDADPLRRSADVCLDALAEIACLEARTAALKVYAAAGYAAAERAMASPAASRGEATAREMSVVAEVACVLTVSERAAGALLAEAHELTTSLPLTLAALAAGSISWQHARFMVDERRCQIVCV